MNLKLGVNFNLSVSVKVEPSMSTPSSDEMVHAEHDAEVSSNQLSPQAAAEAETTISGLPPEPTDPEVPGNVTDGPEGHTKVEVDIMDVSEGHTKVEVEEDLIKVSNQNPAKPILDTGACDSFRNTITSSFSSSSQPDKCNSSFVISTVESLAETNLPPSQPADLYSPGGYQSNDSSVHQQFDDTYEKDAELRKRFGIKECYVPLENCDEMCDPLDLMHWSDLHSSYDDFTLGEFMFYQCSQCDQWFTESSLLEQHLRSHEGTLYSCDQCDMQYTTQELLTVHQAGHIAESRSYKCDICDMRFSKEVQLRHHNEMHEVRTVHQAGQIAESQSYKCNICDMRFPDDVQLRHHNEVHELLTVHQAGQIADNQSFKCDICLMRFPDDDQLRHHEEMLHKNCHACCFCGKVLSTDLSLKKHIKLHFGGKPHTCDLCCKTFTQKRYLVQHQQVHLRHIESGREFTCYFCGKSFFKSGPLLTHVKGNHHKCNLTVDGRRLPFICGRCGRGFRTNSSLDEHHQVHLQNWLSVEAARQIEPTFECGQCNRKFKSANSLNAHKALHSRQNKMIGDEFFYCQLCRTKFRTRKNLARHIKIKHVDGTRCNICSKSFPLQSDLERHRKMHPVKKCVYCGMSYPQRNSSNILCDGCEATAKVIQKCTLCKKFPCSCSSSSFIIAPSGASNQNISTQSQTQTPIFSQPIVSVDGTQNSQTQNQTPIFSQSVVSVDGTHNSQAQNPTPIFSQSILAVNRTPNSQSQNQTPIFSQSMLAVGGSHNSQSQNQTPVYSQSILAVNRTPNSQSQNQTPIFSQSILAVGGSHNTQSQNQTPVYSQSILAVDRTQNCQTQNQTQVFSQSILAIDRTHNSQSQNQTPAFGQSILAVDGTQNSQSQNQTPVFNLQSIAPIDRTYVENPSMDKRYKCNECSQSYASAELLERHRRRHEVIKPFQCAHCDKGFTERGYLDEHLRTHLFEIQRTHSFETQEEYPTVVLSPVAVASRSSYDCDICDMAFTEEAELETHRLTHFEFLPIPQIDLTEDVDDDESNPDDARPPGVYNGNNSRKIMPISQLPRPMMEGGGNISSCTCDICGKSYSTPNSMRRHLRLHTGEKPYPCRYCGRRFGDSSTRKKHERNQNAHPGVNLTPQW